MNSNVVTSRLFNIAKEKGGRILPTGKVLRTIRTKDGKIISQRVSPKGGYNITVRKNNEIIKTIQKSFYMDLGYKVTTWDYLKKSGKIISRCIISKNSSMRKVHNRITPFKDAKEGTLTYFKNKKIAYSQEIIFNGFKTIFKGKKSSTIRDFFTKEYFLRSINFKG